MVVSSSVAAKVNSSDSLSWPETLTSTSKWVWGAIIVATVVVFYCVHVFAFKKPPKSDASDSTNKTRTLLNTVETDVSSDEDGDRPNQGGGGNKEIRRHIVTPPAPPGASRSIGKVYTYESHHAGYGHVDRKSIPLLVFPVWGGRQQYSGSVTDLFNVITDNATIIEWMMTPTNDKHRLWMHAKPSLHNARSIDRTADGTRMTVQLCKHEARNIIECTSRMYNSESSVVADFFTSTFVVNASSDPQTGWNVDVYKMGYSCFFARSNQSPNAKKRQYDMLSLTVLTGCTIQNEPVSIVVYNMIVDTPFVAVRKACKLFRDANKHNPFVANRTIMLVNALSASPGSENVQSKLESLNNGANISYVKESFKIAELFHHRPADLRNIFTTTATTTVTRTSFALVSRPFAQDRVMTYSVSADIGDNKPTRYYVGTLTVVNGDLDEGASSGHNNRARRSIPATLNPDQIRHMLSLRQNGGTVSKLDESTASEFSDSESDGDDGDNEDDAVTNIDLENVDVDRPVAGLPHFNMDSVNDGDGDDDDDDEIYNANDKEILVPAANKPSAPSITSSLTDDIYV